MERIILHVDVNNAFLSWSAVWLLKNGYEKELLELQKWGKRDNCLFCKNCMKSMKVKNEKEKIK